MLAEGRCATLSQPVAPQVTTSMGRTDAKVVAYNSQAFNSLTIAATANNTKLLVDDLYAAVDGKCGKNCAKDPISTHLSSTLILLLHTLLPVSVWCIQTKRARFNAQRTCTLSRLGVRSWERKSQSPSRERSRQGAFSTTSREWLCSSSTSVGFCGLAARRTIWIGHGKLTISLANYAQTS